MLNMLTRYFFPSEVTCQKGSLVRLKFLTGKKAMVVCGVASLEKSGYLAKINTLLNSAGFTVLIHNGVDSDPTKETVESCVDAMRGFNPDWVIACGGGSVLDVAKLARATYKQDDVNWEAIQKPFTLLSSLDRAKLLVIPTTSGSGSEVSPVSVIVDIKSHIKLPIVSENLIPDVVILDPKITVNLPLDITLCSALDAFTHAFESYCSSLHNPMSDIYALSAGRMIVEKLELVIKAPNDVQAREVLLYAALLAGYAQSTTSVGAIHALSHATSAQFDLSHGLANALFLPTIAAFNATASTRPERFLDSVGLESSQELGRWVTDLLKAVSLPTSWASVRAKKNKSVGSDILAQRAYDDVCMRTNPRAFTIAELTQIIEEG